MNFLEHYGWTKAQHEHYITHQKNNLLPGRVISIKGFKYYLATEKGEVETELSGKLLYGHHPEDFPKTGDWVWYMDYGTTGYIIDLFPRLNALTRKTPGETSEKQVLAANINAALLVQGLDRDFNLMRLDRYRVQIETCGIVPLVVLNKADLVENAEQLSAEVREKLGCTVIYCSTYTGVGIEQLNHLLETRHTYLMVGSSGAGKSSLLNVLMQNEKQKTENLSGFNHKGKHTTTTRDLFQLPNGSLVIDSPGMREFGLTTEDNMSPHLLFPKIMELAASCRFADCRHQHEPGCAVQKALWAGELDQALYNSYIKLVKEQERFEIRSEDKKRMEKQFGKITREAKNHRKKYKF